MVNGWHQFEEKPIGSGLAASGPAYRFSHDITHIKESSYIPESWYVQQLVEGGIIGFLLFIGILGIISWKLYRRSIFLFGGFVGILVMNFLLHSFETSYAAVLLFMIIGLMLDKQKPLTLSDK